ncbi:MAG: hypothetical protein A3H24_01530 [Rhodoferax sp. RIFCSPLOWO2_12_FULL_60_11]|nr:MAG: hypothetical protein A3H24_01530 [Rhodoferax sp. RIFCSPLOWO2_12_FULL_60_11]
MGAPKDFLARLATEGRSAVQAQQATRAQAGLGDLGLGLIHGQQNRARTGVESFAFAGQLQAAGGALQ